MIDMIAVGFLLGILVCGLFVGLLGLLGVFGGRTSKRKPEVRVVEDNYKYALVERTCSTCGTVVEFYPAYFKQGALSLYRHWECPLCGYENSEKLPDADQPKTAKKTETHRFVVERGGKTKEDVTVRIENSTDNGEDNEDGSAEGTQEDHRKER